MTMTPAVHSAARRCRLRHGVPPEDVSTATVEVQQPKIKTIAKCMEDGDFYYHERLVCVPETCDVRIELISSDGSATVILKKKVATLLVF